MSLQKLNLATQALAGSVDANLIANNAITSTKLDFSSGLHIPELLKLGGSDEILCPVCAEWKPHGMSCGGVVVQCAECVQETFIEMAQSMIKDRHNHDLIPLRIAGPDRVKRKKPKVSDGGIGAITVTNAWDCWGEGLRGAELVTEKGYFTLPRKDSKNQGILPICEHCENQFACTANNGNRLALKASGLTDEMKEALWP